MLVSSGVHTKVNDSHFCFKARCAFLYSVYFCIVRQPILTISRDNIISVQAEVEAEIMGVPSFSGRAGARIGQGGAI